MTRESNLPPFNWCEVGTCPTANAHEIIVYNNGGDGEANYRATTTACDDATNEFPTAQCPFLDARLQQLAVLTIEDQRISPTDELFITEARQRGNQ